MKKPVWNFEYNGWVGGKFPARNSSGGYHGLLQQWWDFYAIHGARVLLVSENSEAAEDFQKAYPAWDIKITDLPFDLCSGELRGEFDLIICQATLEHLYNPFGAMKNLADVLVKDGILVLHTHSINCQYHAWPRDYIRFMDDW